MKSFDYLTDLKLILKFKTLKNMLKAALKYIHTNILKFKICRITKNTREILTFKFNSQETLEI